MFILSKGVNKRVFLRYASSYVILIGKTNITKSRKKPLVKSMSSLFYSLLKKFIWPRYHEKGPPSYINSILFDKDLINGDGRIKEPAKSVLEFVVLGSRPVTASSIFIALIENQNKPMYGAQIGKKLEKKFQLPKGWFTKTRYYDTRIGKLLKILCRLGVLEETETVDSLTRRQFLGYYINEKLYPEIRKRMLSFMRGGTLSIFEHSPSQTILETEQERVIKKCTKCEALTTSLRAKYCEICGSQLNVVCPKCRRDCSLEYTYCLNCGEKLT